MSFVPALVTFGLLLLTGLAECDITATCTIQSGSGVGTVSGVVTLTQPNSGGTVTIRAQLSGFNATGQVTQHGFHIHEKGNLTNSCTDAGGHYNPTSKTHGAPADVERHNGDLGNIQVDGAGKSEVNITDSVVTLTGAYSSIGRAIVVHELQDDLGRGNETDSKTTGHAGRRLGCCTIVQTSQSSATSSSIFTTTFVTFVGFLLMTSTMLQ